MRIFQKVLPLAVAGVVFLAAPAVARPIMEPDSVTPMRQVAWVIAGIGAGLQALGDRMWTVQPAAGAPAPLSPAVMRSPLRPMQPLSHGTFESVAIPVGNIAMAEKWQTIYGADQSGYFTRRCEALGFDNCDSTFGRTARGAVVEAAGLSSVGAIRLINRRFNSAIRYRSDQANWGRGDVWSNPSQTARNGVGDCEDYAIAKYWALRALGFSEDQLQVVVLLDTRRQLYHSVLAVHVHGQRYILDNLSATVRTDSELPNYMPLVSFVGEKSYIHGFQDRRTRTAMPADLGAVSPGEGV